MILAVQCTTGPGQAVQGERAGQIAVGGTPAQIDYLLAAGADTQWLADEIAPGKELLS